MMKIIQRRERIENVTYSLFFEDRNCLGAGSAYPCDENGVVNLEALHPVARQHYLEYVEHIEDMVAGRHPKLPPVVNRYVHAYWQPAIGLCVKCGAKVYLDAFTNTCDCGADYNMSGHLLASREFWGEETGESVADILGPSREDEIDWDY